MPGVMNRMVALTSGVLQHYDVADDAVDPVGSLVGDIELVSGGRLADHAHDGRFVLVDRSPGGRFADAVRPVGSRVVRRPGDGSSPSLLVRPDGVIAWADTLDPADGDSSEGRLGAAIRRWVAA